jgi:hypothetical protein
LTTLAFIVLSNTVIPGSATTVNVQVGITPVAPVRRTDLVETVDHVAAVWKLPEAVNYLALKDEASNFNGNSEHRGLASFATANIALVSSTGDSRRYHAMCFKTDVLGGVDVSIMRRAAFITPPRADIQRHGGLNVHTARTGFTGRKEPVHLDESFACSRSLVFKKTREHTPTNISDGFRQTVILHHAFYMQILDRYDLIFVNELSRKFVQPILARIGSVFMRLCDKYLGLVSGIASLNLAGKFLLLTFQVRRRLRQVARVIELRPDAG